jgi:hypothetical protein
MCICLFYKEENQNQFSVSNSCVIPRTYEMPIIKIQNNDRNHENQYKFYFLLNTNPWFVEYIKLLKESFIP